MSMNDKSADDSGCYPYDDMKEAHDELRSGDQPEKPHTTTTEKLMKPQSGEVED